MKNYQKFIEQVPKSYFILFVFLIFISSIAEIFGLGLLYPLITSLNDSSIEFEISFINKYMSSINIIETKNLIYLFLTMIIIKNIFFITINYFQFTYIEKFQSKLSYKLLNIYQSLDLNEFKLINSSIFLRNINIETIKSGVYLNTFLFLIAEFFILILIIILCTFISFYYTIIVFLSITIISLAYYINTKKIFFKWAQVIQKLEALRIKNLQFIFYGFKDISSFNMDLKFQKIYQNSQNRFINTKKKIHLFATYIKKYNGNFSYFINDIFNSNL